MSEDRKQVKRALISVYDKTGLEDLARALDKAGVEIVSTGSTAARIAAEQREADRETARQEARQQRAEQKATITLPTAGQPGPAALRTPGRFRLPKHQDTSATLAGQYPFLAEGGLGSEGIFVGQDLYSGGSFVYDPWVLYRRGIITAPNVVLAGIVVTMAINVPANGRLAAAGDVTDADATRVWADFVGVWVRWRSAYQFSDLAPASLS